MSPDYADSFDEIFKAHGVPRRISFYVNVPSRADPSAAPPACDAVVILVPVGHLVNDAYEDSVAAWEVKVAEIRNQVVASINTRLGIEIEKSITHEILNTPITCVLPSFRFL